MNTSIINAQIINKLFAFVTICTLVLGSFGFAKLASAAISEPACSVAVVSDTSNTVTETGSTAFALTFIHSGWNAVITGAEQWIWGTNPVENTTITTTQTFSKTFIWNGPVTSALLTIAADNGYVAKINGTEVSNSVGASTFSASSPNKQVTNFPVGTSTIVTGSNTISITVTNDATPENKNPQDNPAGLLYRLDITGSNPSCRDLTYKIDGYKWNDLNGNGIQDAGENGIAGWGMKASDGDSAPLSTTTNSVGYYSFMVPAGTWTVNEVGQKGWNQTSVVQNPSTGSNVSGNCAFNVSSESHVSSFQCSFGNHELPEVVPTYHIYGNAWSDENQDGASVHQADNGEVPLTGWTITITKGETTFTTTTDASGNYSFDVPAGTWTISDGSPTDWNQTYPINSGNVHVVTVPAPAPAAPVDVSVVSKGSVLASIANFLVPSAYAAVIPAPAGFGPFNFGNKFVGGNHTQTSSHSHTQTQTTSSSGGSSSNTPVGQVLGASTSTVPVGAPKTGGGGTSPVSTVLPTFSAILAGGRPRVIKNG